LSDTTVTLTKPLGIVGINGMWISKIAGKTYEFHHYLGNKSICNISKLLTPKPESYKIESNSSQNFCKYCIKLLKNIQKHVEINNRRKKIQSLYNKQIITPEQAIINFITSDNTDTKYSTLQEMFVENFSEFSFEDILSFMAVQNQIHLKDELVLPIIQGEILY
jgi:hypothetical protein